MTFFVIIYLFFLPYIIILIKNFIRKLFLMINLFISYKEVISYRGSLFIQIKRYVDASTHSFHEFHVSDIDEQLFHKVSKQNGEDYNEKIRADQLWAYLISKTKTKCEEIVKLISLVYSIPCSNAYTETVFAMEI